MRATQLLAPAAAVLIAAACSGENPGSPADGASDWTVVDLVADPVDDHVEEPADVWPDAPVTVSDLVITENPRNALSFYVSWSTSSEVLTELLVDCGDEYTRAFRGERATLTHEVFVMGLIAGLSCTVTAHPDRAGLVGLATATCEDVGPLPPGLPVLSVDVVDAPRMQAGWTMLSVAEMGVVGDATIVAIDAHGRYRWYLAAGVEYESPEAEVMPVAQGVLLGNLRGDSQIASWEGEVLWKLDNRSHHDMRFSPFAGDHMLFLGHGSATCPYGGVEHTAVEMDMATHEIVWEWWICDHWTPRMDYVGWAHLNAIEPVPGERAVLLSSRNQDALFKVDRDTGEIEWVLGRDGDFAMDPSDHFLRQHAPEILPDGSILLFDNGLRSSEATHDGLEARTFSRVLQFALTFDVGGRPDRAEVVWEYTDPEIFAFSRSEADRLPNGNTLIHYCYIQPDLDVVLREVTADLEIVWNVTSPPDVASYRSERFEPYFGHVILAE
ncbi:MAG: aryl-sulfate sulfotransferase [Deltaproteobacteria bacterium]|nr:aryl-sulfate sulfotransferase [Deltaproteobacteria bacterium]